jgi:trans-aconitate methyltransferase
MSPDQERSDAPLAGQRWDPDRYRANAAFVPELGLPVVELLDPQPGERILDLGCGDGQLTLKLAATGANITGVDASPQMAAAARARGVQADVASAEALPYADGAFDAVFSNAALHWVRGHDAMMRQVHRVLRPGGRFVAELGGHGNIAAIRVAFIAALERNGFAGREDDVNYYPTPDAYSRRLERQGFKVERMALIPRPTPLGAGGMAEWLRTFRSGVLDSLPAQLQDVVVQDTTKLLASALRDEEGNWTADYVRLRFIALR